MRLGRMLTLADLLSELAPGVAAAGAVDIPIHQVYIDSRQVVANSLFVALKGEHHDGHAFVESAFDAGATVALVERAIDGVTILDTVEDCVPRRIVPPVAVLVPDSLSALQRLARARRLGMPDLRVVGVTGSVGKTTTKEAIASVLSQRYKTLKNAGNLNNEIGLPLTLMALEDAHEVAVLEMGMYALGEIALLCNLAGPQVGVVTNVGPTHLERLGTIDHVAQAKAELIMALPKSGVAILNGDDPRVWAMRGKAQARVLTFGLGENNDIRGVQITSEGLDGTTFVAECKALDQWGVPSAEQPLRLAALGHHAVMAALAAVAVGLVEGLGWCEIAQGLATQGQGLRLVAERGPKGVTLLDDTYNASPASCAAALQVLARLPGRHVAVLGDMLELGAYENEGHLEVGGLCGGVVNLLIAVGQRGHLIAEGALGAGLLPSAVHTVSSKEQALKILSEELQPGDTVLVKGSRGMAMETMVEALREC